MTLIGKSYLERLGHNKNINTNGYFPPVMHMFPDFPYN